MLGAQEYTSQLKNKVVAKSIDGSPQPATRRYNYVPISVQANRANRVVKLVSMPEKSCSGGWTDESACCKCPDSVDIVINSQGEDCECSQYEINNGCPGSSLLFPFECPKRVLNIRFNPTSFDGGATNAFIVSGQPYVDMTGTVVTIDGTPAIFTPNAETIGAGVIDGIFTTSSVITIVLPTAINGLGAFCVNWNVSPPT